MNFLRFRVDGKDRFGIYDGTDIYECGNFFEKIEKKKKKYNTGEISFLPPSVPSKIIAVGLNYKKHAEELNMPAPEEPVIFIKPSTAALAHGQDIIYPEMSMRVDFEGELAVIIKKTARDVKTQEAKNYILGYTCFNDVTARDLQKKDGQWTRSKSFDTFAPFGPVISDEINPFAANIKVYLNSTLKQDGNSSDMIFDVHYLVSFISRIMTLYPGDVIATGTPVGVGPMQKGDEVFVNIEGIGVLKNRLI